MVRDQDHFRTTITWPTAPKALLSATRAFGFLLVTSARRTHNLQASLGGITFLARSKRSIMSGGMGYCALRSSMIWSGSFR